MAGWLKLVEEPMGLNRANNGGHARKRCGSGKGRWGGLIFAGPWQLGMVWGADSLRAPQRRSVMNANYKRSNGDALGRRAPCPRGQNRQLGSPTLVCMRSCVDEQRATSNEQRATGTRSKATDSDQLMPFVGRVGSLLLRVDGNARTRALACCY